ncbi:hypothetical protein F8M41_013947 [Gigaspora margarita]|uniref:Uncharacterized protein n=1 Tax=Gigaspora margarita TaxID=4874 RepID=A0A8H3WX43_GIGMA|nr:hypothetical protein F8M41_013947 [Gigaspora margarita]
MNSEGNLKQIDSRYGNISASDITDNTSNSDELDGAFSDISENVSDNAQETATQCFALICMETESSEDKEIKEFLHKENISNEIRERNRKKNFRVNKILLIYKMRKHSEKKKLGIGVEKVRAITSSASAISSLTDNQIQDIINCFPKKSTSVDDSSVKYQEKIGITNCNAHVTERNDSSKLSETEISALSQKVSSEDIINEKDEPLPEEDVSVPDNSLDSNSESSDNENSYDENPYDFDYHDNENDDE